MRRTLLILTVLSFALALAIPTVAFAMSDQQLPKDFSDLNGLKRFHIELPASDKDWIGFVARFDNQGNMKVTVFDDPAVMANVLGITVEEVLNSTTANNTTQVSSNLAEKASDDSKVDKTDGTSISTTHRARIDAYAKITDVVYITMNQLDSHHTFDYNGTNVTWESGYSNAYWLEATGWFLYGGPTFNFSGNPLPSPSDYADAFAAFMNIGWAGGPYLNGLLITTTVNGDGSVNASYDFAIDPKGPAWSWHWWGGYSRTQIN